MVAVRCDEVTFAFDNDDPVVRKVDLHVEAGQRVALVGPSGCGKSTLLHLVAGILVPQTGEVFLGDIALSSLDPDDRAAIRMQRIGFVFQFSELLPELSVRENVELPLRMLRRLRANNDAATSLLSQLGIDNVADRLPSQISGGQRQRVAIARALVHQPSVVLADEPTGALDRESGAAALEALLDLSRRFGTSLVVVTHDREVASKFDRTIAMNDGCISV